MRESARLVGAVSQLRRHVRDSPVAGVVLGSGLGDVVAAVARPQQIPFGDIASMPKPRVEGHPGRFVFGLLGGQRVAIMQGRVHLYEGHPPADVVFGVRLMIALGAQTMVLTNAAGGIRSDLEPGNLMLIEDQLNLTGHNCLVGPNEEELGPRFVDMTNTYDRALSQTALQAAKDVGARVGEGVYAGVLGPSYETPAEIRMLGRLGADAVGMSTVLEAIAARHMGARVVGLSCIANKAAGLEGALLSHADVQRESARAAADIGRILEALMGELAN